MSWNSCLEKGFKNKVAIGDCFFRAQNYTRNADPDKYEYRDNDIDARSNFSLPTKEFGKSVIIFCEHNSSLVSVVNKKIF